ILPVVADSHVKGPGQVANLYLNTYDVLFSLELPAYAMVIVCAPLISTVWIGRYEAFFVGFSSLLAVCWFLNTLNAPAFFTYMGTGDLRWGLVSQTTIAILNVV